MSALQGQQQQTQKQNVVKQQQAALTTAQAQQVGAKYRSGQQVDMKQLAYVARYYPELLQTRQVAESEVQNRSFPNIKSLAYTARYYPELLMSRQETTTAPTSVDSAQQASIDFWTSQGYPNYAGRYGPVNIPLGAKITEVKELFWGPPSPQGTWGPSAGLNVTYSVPSSTPNVSSGGGVSGPTAFGGLASRVDTSKVFSTLETVFAMRIPLGGKNVSERVFGENLASRMGLARPTISVGEAVEIGAVLAVPLVGEAVGSTIGIAGLSAGKIFVGGAALGVGVQEVVARATTGKWLSPEQALQTGLISEVGYIGMVSLFTGAGAVWERLPEAITNPLERVGGFVGSVPGRVVQNLPSPAPEFADFVGDVAENVGVQFRQRAPQSLLNLVYGEQLGTTIAIERQWGWTEPVLSMKGISEISSREAFEAWENLYAPTTVEEQAQTWFRVYRGVPQTPMSVTLSKALESRLPTRGWGGLSAEQVLQEVETTEREPSVSFVEMETVPKAIARSNFFNASLGSVGASLLVQRTTRRGQNVRPLTRQDLFAGASSKTAQASILDLDLDVGQVQVSTQMLRQSQQTKQAQAQQEAQVMSMFGLNETVEVSPSTSFSFPSLDIYRRRPNRKAKYRPLGVKGLLWPVALPEDLLGLTRRRKRKR